MTEISEKLDKRQQLLEVAEQLFAKNGFEAVSVRQLAAEAGVNLAMVSYYFGSKDGLFEELLKAKFPKSRNFLEGLAQADLHPWEKVSRTIDEYVDKFFQGRAFHRVIMRELSLQQRPGLIEIIRENMSRNHELIRGFIYEGIEKGLFRPVDVELTVATLMGSISMAVNQNALMCYVLKEKEPEAVYSEKNSQRYKKHLKMLFQAHLMIEQP